MHLRHWLIAAALLTISLPLTFATHAAGTNAICVGTWQHNTPGVHGYHRYCHGTYGSGYMAPGGWWVWHAGACHGIYDTWTHTCEWVGVVGPYEELCAATGACSSGGLVVGGEADLPVDEFEGLDARWDCTVSLSARCTVEGTEVSPGIAEQDGCTGRDAVISPATPFGGTGYYVVYGQDFASADVPKVTIYEESNGEPGLQRDDEGCAEGEGPADTIVF